MPFCSCLFLSFYSSGIRISLPAINFPNSHLLIVGIGPYFKKLQKVVIRLSIESNVTFLGYVEWDELINIYTAADVFCMPSLGESQGLVIQEAKACGTPCVVLNAVGAGEQIEDLKDGIVVENSEDFNTTCKIFTESIVANTQKRGATHPKNGH